MQKKMENNKEHYIKVRIDLETSYYKRLAMAIMLQIFKA
jgi:hypothetical protein